MSTETEKNVIGKFDCYGDASTLGTRWTRWLKSFELFADAQGLIITEDSDKNKQRRRKTYSIHLQILELTATTKQQSTLSTPTFDHKLILHTPDMLLNR